MKRHAILAATVSFALVLAGCGGDEKVGGGVKIDPTDGTTDCAALGCPTTTTAPPTTVAPPPTTSPPTTTRPTPTTSPPTTQAGPTVALTIGIYSDTSGKNQFEPRQGAVRARQVVRFQNNDTQPRGVEESNGAWRSPDIPPGGFWDFTPTAGGVTYNYNDTTRPYAVGQLVVR